ncbi:hypothetical protein EZS27_002269 [termite gut metagenome]|uniref:Uncharacterized protein n=1 Tax=termite gut metagenome TaxID=433724 RepID=A0A5J4SY60_9ZZZZ
MHEVKNLTQGPIHVRMFYGVGARFLGNTLNYIRIPLAFPFVHWIPIVEI